MHSYFAISIARCYATVSADDSVLSNSTEAIEQTIKTGFSEKAIIFVEDAVGMKLDRQMTQENFGAITDPEATDLKTIR